MPAQGGWSASVAQNETGCSSASPTEHPRITMNKDSNSGYDAIFVGGGVIGLACAWRAARRGARVCVLEREHPAAGATGVAAGMLAPVGEASWGEEALVSLNLESLRRWPGFARELEG